MKKSTNENKLKVNDAYSIKKQLQLDLFHYISQSPLSPISIKVIENSNRTIFKDHFTLMHIYIVMLFKIKSFLLIMGIITSIVTLNSTIKVIQAQAADPQLKRILDQAKALAFNTMYDDLKDKVFSAPSNTKELWDICHTQAENYPSVSNPEQYCFNIIIDKCQKNSLSSAECYATNFVSIKAEDIDIAVLNSANAKMNAHT